MWLPSSDISLTFQYGRKSIPYLPKTRLMACYVSGDACKSRIFRAKLQTLSSNHGDQGRVRNMISIYPNGCNRERSFSLCETTINQILLFLYDLFQRGVGYSVMNTAWSSLSTFIKIDGVPVGQHPVITRFMKGVFSNKPALPNTTLHGMLEFLLHTFPK